RAVVEAAHDVRDPEVDVVDDRGKLVRRAAVRPQERDSVETLAELRTGFAVPLRALALAHRSLVPLEPEPAEVADDLLLPTGHVPGGVGVVDSQQHPVPESPVRDRAEGVADVERAGRAGGETDPFHGCRPV